MGIKLVIALTLALLTPSTAAAHGRWYDSAANTAYAIESKYPAVIAASCRPLPEWAQSRYGADSYVNKSGTRVWNHFGCGVYSTWSRTACLTVAHLVGQTRSGIVLTSWLYGGRGCTTRDLFG